MSCRDFCRQGHQPCPCPHQCGIYSLDKSASVTSGQPVTFEGPEPEEYEYSFTAEFGLLDLLLAALAVALVGFICFQPFWRLL